MAPVALEEVVFAALSSLSGDTSRVRVDVPETLPPVLTDGALLERSVANLLANALAWSPPEFEVVVTATVTAPDSGPGEAGAALATDRRHLARSTEAHSVELRIADRGPGIPAEERPEVFRPFQRQGDSAAAQPDGVGLGLAVARGFVDLMDGRLELDDTPGGGLTAVISLPVPLPAPAAAAPTSGDAAVAADGRSPA
jgi:two-component system sensor histidine kinase KdpD